MRNKYIFLAASIITLAMSGCGKAQPVHGKIVYPDGSPAKELAGHLIMFQSVEHKVSASGVIGPEGTFTVGTETETDGAMLGKQRIAIAPPAREIMKPQIKQVIPDWYGSFETSKLEIEIKSGTNTPTITVEKLK